MSEQVILSKILITLNLIFLMIFVLLGAEGGFILLFLFFIPIITFYFEINWRKKFNEKAVRKVRIVLNIANIIVLLIFVYNIFMTALLFVLLA